MPRTELPSLMLANVGWLGLSGVPAAVFWIFYYEAAQFGDVSTVALIDKGSVVVALLVAYIALDKKLTKKCLAAC